ncbi:MULTISPECIES: potassium channel family protein [Halorussus]|uniref:potassium channel family protein n=1 Tax=Halorussus TaxID=1070314 RepID=UPI00211164DA|nr:potassium channel family protein [Halorussus vallis]
MKRLERAAERVVHRIAETVGDERTATAVERSILALVVANTAAVVLGTVDSIALRYGGLLRAVECFAVGAFTAEFVARVTWRLARGGDRSGLADPHLGVDLFAILPFYVGLATGVGGLGSSSLLRVLRLLKLVRYFDGVDLLVRVLRRKRADLVASAFATTLLWLLAASSVYFAEHEAQPEAFSSIPAALWWAGMTITTVGYGDVYPVTPLGRSLGVVVSLLSLGVAAVPSSILVSGILEETGSKPERCPHCGRRREE